MSTLVWMIGQMGFVQLTGKFMVCKITQALVNDLTFDYFKFQINLD